MLITSKWSPNLTYRLMSRRPSRPLFICQSPTSNGGFHCHGLCLSIDTENGSGLWNEKWGMAPFGPLQDHQITCQKKEEEIQSWNDWKLTCLMIWESVTFIHRNCIDSDTMAWGLRQANSGKQISNEKLTVLSHERRQRDPPAWWPNDVSAYIALGKT